MKNVVFTQNTQLKLAFEFVQFTNRNVFLTGNAGTGKTTFLHNLKTTSFKRMVVVAPTGVAAINAGGVTIHSFFQMPFGPNVPVDDLPGGSGLMKSRVSGNVKKFNRQKIKIIKSLDLLIIDEISMVRADLLDGIDEVLRRYKNKSKPFGGVQLLMIGDLHQLAPVVKEDEWQLLRPYYNTVFFFSSLALQKTSFVSIELTHIFRQSDEKFIKLLGKVRENRLDTEAFEELSERYIPGFEKEEHEGYIILTTHNAKAKEINEIRLRKLQNKSRIFKAEVKGEFSEYTYPTEYELELKEDAQVMFVKNDPEPVKDYFNGKIGVITEIDKDSIFVQCPDMDYAIDVPMLTWENIRYGINEQNKEIQENVIGTFTQYPLKLAWAITIHKSQGLTFDKAVIDARAAFASGQVYVALSRCRTLEGMVLSSMLSYSSIKSDPKIQSFTQEISENPTNESDLDKAKKAFEEMLLLELFDFSPVQRRLYYLIKLVNENAANLQPGIREVCREAAGKMKTEIIDIVAKFIPQLKGLLGQSLSIDQNQVLQERIKKASTYFYDKTNSLLFEVFQNLSIDCDNKAIKKVVKAALDKLNEEIYITKHCLESCTDGFEMKSYLNVRAKASIENMDRMPGTTKKEAQPYAPVQHPGLYKKLKDWRDKTADEESKPVFWILPRKTMNEICNLLPATSAEMLDIKGMGRKKFEQFGNKIFEIVSDYRKENNLEVFDWTDIAPKPKRPTKIASRQISYDLFNGGKTIAEVAKEREMAVSTIESHLSYFVGTGKLDVKEFVSEEKIHLITMYFTKKGDYGISNAKMALGDDVSYQELRFVLEHLKAKGKIDLPPQT